MGLSQELTYQPVAKKSLPPKPKNQADTRLELRKLPSKPESNMDIWQERALADSLDTPPMEQTPFNWPSSAQEESHFNEGALQQEEFSWNNNMHDQLFNGSDDFIPEEELHQEHEEVQQVEEMQVQVDQMQQPKEEMEDMRCIAPHEAEGIQPKNESGLEEIYTFGVGEQNQLEFLNLEQKDALSSVLQDSGITDMDLNSFNMDTSIFDDSLLSATGVGTTETFVTGAASASATIADLLNVGDSVANDDDPDWMPDEGLLTPTTSRARQPAYARKSTIHSVKKTSMMKKKPGRPAREGPYQIPTIPSRNALNGMSEEEIQGLKYRRMRELNNQASKACRAKRKNKQQMLEEELVVEQERNLRLRQKLETMEKEYSQYKKSAASAKIL